MMSEEYESAFEEIMARNKEIDGRVMASNADAHPFMQSLFLLKLFLGLFTGFIVFEPFFVTMSRDQLAMSLAMFAVQVLISFVVFFQFHLARVEEVLIRFRSKMHGTSQNLENALPAAVLLFSMVVVAKLIGIVAARCDGLEFGTNIAITVTSVFVIGAALVFVERHKRAYVQLE